LLEEPTNKLQTTLNIKMDGTFAFLTSWTIL